MNVAPTPPTSVALEPEGSTSPSRRRTARIALVNSTTQLLPLMYILRRTPRPPCDDILLWTTYTSASSASEAGKFLQRVAPAYPFALTVNLSGLETPRRRTRTGAVGALTWPLESVVRHRRDARAIRRELAPFLKGNPVVELWTDEGIHASTRLLHGMFPGAIKVKVPHAFDLERGPQLTWRASMVDKARALATPPRRALWHATRAFSGVRYSATTGYEFDRAYSLNEPSKWAPESVDLSATLSLASLAEDYAHLPEDLRAEVDALIAHARGGDERPWILLVLFGLSEERIAQYRRAVRLLRERYPELLEECRLVVKPHPTSWTELGGALVAGLKEDLGRDVGLFDSHLNLDVMWHLLPVRVVFAGPCGSLPIVRRIGAARILVIRESLDELVQTYPGEKGYFEEVVEGLEMV